MKPRIIAAALLIGLSLSFPATASADRPVTYDVAWRFRQAGSSDDAGLYSFGSGAACTPTRATYLQWDLSEIPHDTGIGHAEIRLNVISATGIQTDTRLGIYALPDGWTEDTPNPQLPAPPALDTALQTIAAPESPSVIRFEGAGPADPLVAYITDRVKSGSDSRLSFAIMFSGNCDPNSDSTYNFEDQENNLGTGVGPDLTVSGGASAIAVRVFRSSGTQDTWRLYAALAVIGVVVAAAIAISRRKTD